MAQKDLTIIKVGTGVLTRVEDGTLDLNMLERLVAAISEIITAGHRCLFVSSGAVGAGVSAFQLEAYPEDIATKQACAAVGQSRLMSTYESLFSKSGMTTAQLLLTAHDLKNEKNRRRVSRTIERLLEEEKILPIINENDSVAVQELRVGDNDMLSAQLAQLIGARRLILLTTVDGLLHPENKTLISEVSDIDEVLDFARDVRGKFSIGGMASKLRAVKVATDAGIETFIANGENPENILSLIDGKGIGTRFLF